MPSPVTDHGQRLLDAATRMKPTVEALGDPHALDAYRHFIIAVANATKMAGERSRAVSALQSVVDGITERHGPIGKTHTGSLAAPVGKGGR